jgi:hypothetical protein
VIVAGAGICKEEGLPLHPTSIAAVKTANIVVKNLKLVIVLLLSIPFTYCKEPCLRRYM